MKYKIIIDAYRGGSDIGVTSSNIIEKKENLELANLIYNRLKNRGVAVSLIRDGDIFLSDDDRISKINSLYDMGNNTLVISNRLNSGTTGGIEINYALRNNDLLVKDITDKFEKNGFIVNKYYQKRSEEDTAEDSDIMIRETDPDQTLIIYYGYINNDIDKKNIINNLDLIAKSIADGVLEYIGIFDEAYIVKKGDTLFSIASKYNTDVDTIKKLNNLATNSLLIGQTLKLPVEDSIFEDESNYIVKKGDTLYGIAKNNNISVEELKNLNNLTNNNLTIGQSLIIKNPSKNIYIVKKGDTLYGIAKNNNISVEELKNLNNLTNNNLTIGQNLIIPNSSEITYIVKKGDNLYSIASFYGVSVEEIKKINNLSDNLISIGQILKIPN